MYDNIDSQLRPSPLFLCTLVFVVLITWASKAFALNINGVLISEYHYYSHMIDINTLLSKDCTLTYKCIESKHIIIAMSSVCIVHMSMLSICEGVSVQCLRERKREYMCVWND
jgi:hypothetical protein